MKLRWLTILAVLAGMAIQCGSSQAQIGIYATFAGDRRHVTDVLSSPPVGSDNTDTAWPYGTTIGLYDDFAKFGPIRFGSDLRGEFVHGSYTSNTGLFGLRLALKTSALPIRPYIQGSAGVAHFGSTASNASSTNLEYRIAGGLDYTLLPHLDWRVIEVGRGSLVDYSFGSGVNQTNSLYTFSTGLVFRLH
jgi:hypothetical protein